MQEAIDRGDEFVSGNPTPEHGITIKQPHSAAMHYVALCLCGWKSRPAIRRQDATGEARTHLAGDTTRRETATNELPRLEYDATERDPFIGPCPSWCVEPHEVVGHDDDRVHFGPTVTVVVGDIRAEFIEYGESGPRYRMGHVEMYLEQRVNHAAPRLQVGLNDSGIAVLLRLEEATALARTIEESVASACE